MEVSGFEELFNSVALAKVCGSCEYKCGSLAPDLPQILTPLDGSLTCIEFIECHQRGGTRIKAAQQFLGKVHSALRLRELRPVHTA